MSSISSRMAHQVKTRAFQQLFVNYAKCLRNHKRDLGVEEVKKVILGLVDKAVRKGVISNRSFSIVTEKIEELYEMSCEELMLNETLNGKVLEGILGDVEDLSQSLTSGEDLKSIMRFKQAERNFQEAKDALVSDIETYASDAIDEFFELFSTELKAGCGL